MVLLEKHMPGYAGPATGIHHEAFKKKFQEDIDVLLSEEIRH
jgi:hypothetical protein